MFLCSFCSISSIIDDIVFIENSLGLNTGNICEEGELRRGAQLESSGKLSPPTATGDS